MIGAVEHRRRHLRLLANIHFHDIDTPLKQCVAAHPGLVRPCEAIHAAVSK